MINSLKSDFYRVFKSKTIYILLAVLAGLSLFTVLLFKIAENIFDDQIFLNGKNLFLMGMADQAVLFSAIFVSIFICGDFSSGMMKNYVSGNISRTKVFFSKIIVCLTVAVIILLADALLLGSFGSMFFGYGEFAAVNITEFIVKFLLEILLLTAFVSIFVFMAFTIRSTGGVVAVNILIASLIGSILTSVAFISPSLENLVDYWLTGNISYAATSGYFQELREHLLSILLTGTIYTAIFSVPAYIMFRFRDVR